MKTTIALILASVLAITRDIASALFGRHYLPHMRVGGWVTLLDIKKMEDGIGHDIVEENVANHPELLLVPAETMTGTSMQLTVRTDLPTIGFSEPNAGITQSKGGYLTRTFNTAFLDALIKTDVRLLQNRTAESAGRYLASEQSGYVEAAVRHAGRQFWYGVANDSKGFPGLIAQMSTDADHVINATGTTSAKSSVFFLSLGPSKVEWLLGNGTSIAFDEWRKETVSAPDGKGGEIEAMTSWMHFAPGARLANRNAMLRIKNLTEESGKKLTWDLMQDAQQKFIDELGMVPTHVFMTGRSRRQLRDESVTAENKNPPLPTEFEGIPIVQSHSLSNTETI